MLTVRAGDNVAILNTMCQRHSVSAICSQSAIFRIVQQRSCARHKICTSSKRSSPATSPSLSCLGWQSQCKTLLRETLRICHRKSQGSMHTGRQARGTTTASPESMSNCRDRRSLADESLKRCVPGLRDACDLHWTLGSSSSR